MTNKNFLDINDVFSGNKELLENTSVSILVNYVSELEDIIFHNNIQKKYSKKCILKELLAEIYTDCTELLKTDEENERFGFDETVDFKLAIQSLRQHILKMDEDYNLFQ
jgi:hypothetical protein